MTEQQQTIMNEYFEYLILSGKTVENPAYSLKIFFKYADEMNIDCLSLKISEAQDFQTNLMTSSYLKGTITVIIGCMTGFYTYLRKRKIILSNPFLEIKKVKRNKELPRNIFSEDKMNKFLMHFREFVKGKDLIERRQLYKAHVISELMYSTGMRMNEVISLEAKDIDFDNGTVKIYDRKTKSERKGILNEYCQKVLKIYVERMRELVIFGKNNADVNLLFGSKGHLHAWFNAIVDRESRRLGYGHMTSHNFRHAVGCHLLRAGCDMRFIQEILGHKELSTTQIYTKIEKEDLKNVIDKYHPRRKGKYEKS